MIRLGAFAAVSILLGAPGRAASLPELFQNAKAEIRGESWTKALRTLDALDAEASRPGREDARRQLAAPLAFYRGVCEANLGHAEEARLHFGAFLAIEPNASMDPSMYSKKAIAAFQAARKDAIPPPSEGMGGGPSVFQAFQEFKLPRNSGERVDADWADGPVRWIMTAEERSRWIELRLGADLEEFVDRFWESRNPRPGNPDNAFKTSFDRRVAFADAHFVVAEATRGSMTDRGMVFVVLGPPSYVGRKPLRGGDEFTEAMGLSRVGALASARAQRAFVSAGEPAGETAAAATDAFFGPGARATDTNPSWREIWHYRRELLPKSLGYQQVDVEFLTRKGHGIAVLQRDPPALAALDAARARFDSP